MIIISLNGGLGNQLFQLYTGLAYSIKYSIPCKISSLKKSFASASGDPRPTYWNNLLINLKSFIEKINLEQQVYQYTEPSFHFIPIPKISYNFKLQGYFQSFKYFQDQKTEIGNLIGLKELHSNVLSTYSRYFNTKNPIISLHFRIGDYKYLTDHHPILDNKYYINAITFIKDTLKNDKLSILCFNEKQDDIIVKKNINALKSKFTNCDFIQINYSIEDWKQLLIMSCCHHNIIANSSFSWWGAYLNTYENNIVCYPNMWFGKNLLMNNTKDLFPINWNKIVVNH